MNLSQSFRGLVSEAMSALPVPAFASGSGKDCSHKNQNSLLQHLININMKISGDEISRCG